MNDHDLKKIDEMFQHHIGILTENLQNKSQKIDAVAADLKEHRADTEAHKKIWRKSRYNSLFSSRKIGSCTGFSGQQAGS